MTWKNLKQPTAAEIRDLRRNYNGKARFLIDESAGVEVARVLEQLGCNTKYVGELGLLGRSDEDIFAAAWREERVVVTHDADFLNDRRFPQNRNPGVVIVHPGADGRNGYLLMACLMKAVQIGGKTAGWFRGNKLDFSSAEEFSVKSIEGRSRFRWPAYGDAMVWEE